MPIGGSLSRTQADGVDQSSHKDPLMTYRQVRRAIVSNNLTDRITSMLRDDIVSGKYEPGRQLPAGKDLSAAFGVSITVVREALSRLKSDGLVA